MKTSGQRHIVSLYPAVLRRIGASERHRFVDNMRAVGIDNTGREEALHYCSSCFGLTCDHQFFYGPQ